LHVTVKHIPELDGVRAIAIICVLVEHFRLIGPRVPGSWFLGVDIFFVLSGFLITALLMAEQERTGTIDLRAFYLRRARRILPALAAAIILAVALGGASLTSALLSAVFLGNLLGPKEMGWLVHTWSLAVEEHFYLAWPLIFALRSRTFILFVVIGGALAVRLAAMTGFDWDFAYRATPARIDSTAIGCLAALYSRWFQPPPATVPAVLILMILYSVEEWTMIRWGVTVFALLVASAVVGVQDMRWLASAPLKYVGTRSYGIYLYHFPIFSALPQVPARLTVALVFLVAEISYRTVEAYFRAPRRAAETSVESNTA
jgi:peptidoglycan/LPS O-acetylase OafA/YrhL